MADISRALKFSWDVKFLKVRGALRLDDGDIDGALHDADAMLKLDPENASAMALRGAAYARKKDYGHALAESRQGDQGRRQRCAGLSASAVRSIWRKTTSIARWPISTAPSNSARSVAAPYRARAMIYKAKGDTAKAISDLGQAIQRDPRPADLYFERAALRKAKGETAQALADLNDGLARKPDNLAGLLARAQIRQGKGDAAGGNRRL